MEPLREKLLPIFGNRENEVDAYLDFITSKYQEQDSQLYSERHHILPESLFPEYAKCDWNIIKLSAYDHFVAHYLLAFTKNSKMMHALTNMNRLKTLNVRKNLQIIQEEQMYQMARMYAQFREELQIAISKINSGRKHQQQTRDKIQKRQKGFYNVILKQTGENIRITQEEYQRNKEEYISKQYGRKHSIQTKQKMSESSNKDKTAYTNKLTGELCYSDIELSGDWIKGAPILQEVASERFTNSVHWTNIKTGEQFRSKNNPGPDWVRKRSNFKNFYSGKINVIDLVTGEIRLIDKNEKKSHNVVFNSDVYIYGSYVQQDPQNFYHLLNLPKQIIKNGITVAKTAPNKLITNAAIKFLSAEEKMEYKHIVGKQFHSIFGIYEIQKIKAANFRLLSTHVFL